MNTDELIKRYGLELTSDEKVKIDPYKAGSTKSEREVTVNLIKNNRDAIVAELISRRNKEFQDKKDRAEDLKRNVPGLGALREARAKWDHYHYLFNKAIEKGDVRMPLQPSEDLEALTKRYPIAVAYLMAEGWSNSSNIDKSIAGDKAMEAIASGEDYKKVIAEMEREWSGYCDKHAWD